ncbi:MAG: beta-galactosidase [Lentisphaeria bacterium]|nr:beta-galactosidase [Lentisphaeria bacterium]
MRHHLLLVALVAASPALIAQPAKPAPAAGIAELSAEPYAPAPNLLSNPSFETISAVRPQNWTWDQRNTDATFALDDQDADDGRIAIRLTNKTPFGAHVYNWFGHIGDVPVKPNTRYTICLSAKTNSSPSAWFGGGKGWRVRKTLPNTSGKWQRISHSFETDPDTTAFPFMVVVEHPSDGIWIDNAGFFEGDAPPPAWNENNPENTVEISPRQPKPLSRRDQLIDPRWDPRLYPRDQWLFVNDAADFDGVVGLTTAPANAQALIEFRDADSGRVLATASTVLRDGGAGGRCWLLHARCNLAEANAAQIVISATVSDQGAELARYERRYRLVTPALIASLLSQLDTQRQLLAVVLDGLGDRIPAICTLRLRLALYDRFSADTRQDCKLGNTDRAWVTYQDLLTMIEDGLREAQAIKTGALPPPTPVPSYVTSPITIAKSSFLATQRFPDGRLLEQTPTFFTGYGHFAQVRKDIELFPSYGINMIQIEQGPRGVVEDDGKINPKPIENLVTVFARAEKANISINLLLSPHYFPDWALKKWPDLAECQGGFFKYCVHAPEARAIIERYLRAIVPALKDSPALHSYCLSNEPLSTKLDQCPHIRTQWPQWLERRHGSIDQLNQRWHSAYASFADIPVPKPFPDGAIAYDFVQFNQETFAAFHQWLADVIHDMAPAIPVHAKIMMAAHFNKNPAGIWSVSPELFAHLSQINGNDACNFPRHGHPQWYNGWQRYEMGYDFQRSMRDLPVFNSENHIISDRDFSSRWPIHSYSALIQGALHGQSATTFWVWERSNDPVSDLAGSILHRPNHVLAVSAAAMDLNRHAPVVTTFQQEPPSVVHLWSLSTVLHGQSLHLSTMDTLWTSFCALGQTQGFLTERQLNDIGTSGKLPPVLRQARLLVLPAVSHLPAAALPALDMIRKQGIAVVLFGDSALDRDEYDQPLPQPPQYERLPLTKAYDDQPAALLPRLGAWGVTPAVMASDTDGRPLYGLEFRSVEHAGQTYTALCNQRLTPVTVSLRHLVKPCDSHDLLANQPQTSSITLPPLQPMILLIKK